MKGLSHVRVMPPLLGLTLCVVNLIYYTVKTRYMSHQHGHKYQIACYKSGSERSCCISIETLTRKGKVCEPKHRKSHGVNVPTEI